MYRIPKLTFVLLVNIIMFSITSSAQTTIIALTSGTDYSNQVWEFSGFGKPLNQGTIEKYWNEHKYITSAAYTSHGWFIAMNEGTNWTNQSYKYAYSWPDEYVHVWKDKGYMITSIAASDERWFVVTSENTNITDQQICSAPSSILEPWIRKWWDKDYYITGIAAQKGLWTVVMSKLDDYTNQYYKWASDVDDIKSFIKKYWDKGYIITACEYSNGRFFCIMTETSKSKNQGQSRFISESDDPSSFIKKGWDKKWKITYIGG